MTRFGFLLFNLLITVTVYSLIYISGNKHDALLYMLTYFSAPYIGMMFFMALYALIRWFMTQNHEIAAEGITFIHAIWFTLLVTFIAYELLNAGGITKFITHIKAGVV